MQVMWDREENLDHLDQRSAFFSRIGIFFLFFLFLASVT